MAETTATASLRSCSPISADQPAVWLIRIDQYLGNKRYADRRYTITDADGTNAYQLPTYGFLKYDRLQNSHDEVDPRLRVEQGEHAGIWMIIVRC